MLLKDSVRPLLRYGAARRVIGDMTQALTVILKPGYAPVEQYAEVPGSRTRGPTSTRFGRRRLLDHHRQDSAAFQVAACWPTPGCRCRRPPPGATRPRLLARSTARAGGVRAGSSTQTSPPSAPSSAWAGRHADTISLPADPDVTVIAPAPGGPGPYWSKAACHPPSSSPPSPRGPTVAVPAPRCRRRAPALARKARRAAVWGGGAAALLLVGARAWWLTWPAPVLRACPPPLAAAPAAAPSRRRLRPPAPTMAPAPPVAPGRAAANAGGRAPAGRGLCLVMAGRDAGWQVSLSARQRQRQQDAPRFTLGSSHPGQGT